MRLLSGNRKCVLAEAKKVRFGQPATVANQR